MCDIGNNVIRKIDMKTGVISTFAGTGKPGATPDGAPIAGTPLKGPRSLDFDKAGNLWLVTREGNQVFKFDLKAGTIHHMAMRRSRMESERPLDFDLKALYVVVS